MTDKESPENADITRRGAIRLGSAAVASSGIIGVTTGTTDSGFVELTTTATIPADTEISIRIYEDSTGDGTANSQQEKKINAGTDVTTEYEALDGVEAQAYQYWLEITLSTSDDSITPELDSATVTLPEEEDQTEQPTETETDPQGLDEIIDNYLFFVAAAVTTVAGIGLASKSLAVGALAAYVTFALIAIETGTQLFQNILVVTLVLVFVGFAFKFWRLEGMGE